MPGLRAVFNSDGQDQIGMTYTEIWDYLMQDTDDPDEIATIASLKDVFTEDKEKPFYHGSIKLLDNGRIVTTDLLWKRSKVALFLTDSRDEYELAKTSDWKAFSLADSFSAVEFLSAIKGG